MTLQWVCLRGTPCAYVCIVTGNCDNSLVHLRNYIIASRYRVRSLLGIIIENRKNIEIISIKIQISRYGFKSENLAEKLTTLPKAADFK